MSEPHKDASEVSAALCDFLDLYLDDAAAGRKRPLAEYLRRFPGREEDVAREFFALGAPVAPVDGGGAIRDQGMVGHYRLIEKLGQGGQGTVFLAQDLRLERRVALKLLEGACGGLSATRAARLKREAVTLSRLDHPRLCVLYDADLDGERPYLAMRYVAGETLGERIARARDGGGGVPSGDALLARLPQTASEIDAVLRFVESVARAIHVAHEAGIIHRDLKPGNVMIGTDGDPVVLDFGLARDASSEAAITMTGDAFGTLAYMAPEQLAGARDLDRRADVYALGVTAFESLTLRRPVEAPTREALLRDALAGQHQDPLVMNRALPRDVATVLACALETDPDRRYPTALALAEDLRRIREHEPILARPAGVGTHVRRFARRHPAAMAGGAATLFLLVAGLAVTIALLARVTNEQKKTRVEQSRLAALRQASLAQTLGAEKPALALRLAIDAARRERHPEINNVLYDLLDRCHEAKTLSVGESSRWTGLGFEPLADGYGRLFVGYAGGIAAFDILSGASRVLVEDPAGTAEPPRLALDCERKTLVSAHRGGVLRIWDLSTDVALRSERQGSVANPTFLEWAADGARVAVGGADGAVVIHAVDVAAPAPVRVDLPGRRVTTVRFDPSGRRVAVTVIPQSGAPPADCGGAVFDARTGERLFALGPPRSQALWSAWSPSGDRVAVARDAEAFVFDAGDGRELARFPHSDVVRWLAFAPRDGRLVTGSRDGVCAFDLVTGKRVGCAGDFRERSVTRGEFSPDGSRLAVISWDQTASVIACDLWTEERKLKGLERPRGVCWTPDGRFVVASDEANLIHVFFAGDRPHLPVLRGHDDRVVSVAFDARGGRVLTASADGRARVFSEEGGVATSTFDHEGPVTAAFFADEDHVVSVGGGRARAFTIRGPGPAHEAGAGAGPRVVDAWRLGGGMVLLGFDDGGVLAWNAATGAIGRTFAAHEGPITSAAVHKGRRLVATGGSDGTVRVHDIDGGGTIATLRFASEVASAGPDELSRVFALAFDGAGDRVVAGCEDLRVRVFEIASGRLVRAHAAPTPGRFQVDPSGRWLLASAKWRGRVSFLDLSDDDAVFRPAPIHDSHMVAAIGFSERGGLAMAASLDGTIRLWAIDGWRSVGLLQARCGILLDAALSPDGTRVAVGGADRTARLWPVDPLAVAERASPVDDRLWQALKPSLDREFLDP